MHPSEQLQSEARSNSLDVYSEAFAAHMDAADPLRHLRQQFCMPRMGDLARVNKEAVTADEPCLYFCGNSLGLQPKGTRELVTEELDLWAKAGVTGHFPDGGGKRPWVTIDEPCLPETARVVGALPDEVAVMNTLTVNLNLLMVPFYEPTPQRYKILVEAKAFPSDHFAVISQIRQRGFDPATALIEIKPRPGQQLIADDDIVAAIEAEGDSIACVLIGGVHYYTGQFFDLPRIAQAAHAKGCMFGVDLAHAAGNVPLKLHEWGVDFACWCSYKYLNSGPGGIAGAFVHNKHVGARKTYFAGWWGVKLSERFRMEHVAEFMPGIRGMQLSNPGVLQTVSLLGSLQVFAQTSMTDLRAKSLLLTGYLEMLLKHVLNEPGKPKLLEIITPSDPERRGCQLSVLFHVDIVAVFKYLEEHGAVCDVREPDVMRLAPAPLYNTFTDVYRLVHLLKDAFAATTGWKA